MLLLSFYHLVFLCTFFFYLSFFHLLLTWTCWKNPRVGVACHLCLFLLRLRTPAGSCFPLLKILIGILSDRGGDEYSNDWLRVHFHLASFVKICPTELATITCHNDTKIFIESVTYGRTDNVTCLGQAQGTPSCNLPIDLSWRVTPICQGQSSCVINGSYDGQEKPCDGNNTNYFNISYNCMKSKLENMI